MCLCTSVCVCVLKFEMEITTFTTAVSSTYSVSSIVQRTPLSLSLFPPEELLHLSSRQPVPNVYVFCFNGKCLVSV